MAKYLKLFKTHTQYETYINGQDAVKPNVSYCEDDNGVHYNPFVSTIITYEATSKLVETTSQKNNGLHTNAFDCAIASHTFENGVGTIEFDGEVTRFYNYAFIGCSEMTSIEIPSGVTMINGHVFENCSGLTSIDILNSVTDIGSYAFSGCSGLTSVIIGSGVTYIGERAFTNCSSISSITIPDSVTVIDTGAFAGCSGLTSAIIGSGITRIGGFAFGNCLHLDSITSRATTAPTINNNPFEGVTSGGTLYVPIGSSGYDTWIYNKLPNWTMVEQ